MKSAQSVTIIIVICYNSTCENDYKEEYKRAEKKKERTIQLCNQIPEAAPRAGVLLCDDAKLQSQCHGLPSQSASSSGKLEIYPISWQSVRQLLRYFSLDQRSGLGPADITNPGQETPLAGARSLQSSSGRLPGTLTHVRSLTGFIREGCRVYAYSLAHS